jgi:hypothetical protein
MAPTSGVPTDVTGAAESRTWLWPAIAVTLGAGALALAIVSGLAVKQDRSTYSWGIPTAAAGVDADWHSLELRGRFTPLLLAAPPDVWHIRWTCDATPAAAIAGSVEVFGSVSGEEVGPALRLILADDTFAVTMADEVLVEVPRQVEGSSGCSYWFTLGVDGSWRIARGDQELGSGSISEQPVLTGFASDLATGEAIGSVGVVVTTRRHGSTSSAPVKAMQGAAVVLGVLSVLCLMRLWRSEDRREPQ